MARASGLRQTTGSSRSVSSTHPARASQPTRRGLLPTSALKSSTVAPEQKQWRVFADSAAQRQTA